KIDFFSRPKMRCSTWRSCGRSSQASVTSGKIALPQALGHFDLITRINLHIERRILANLPRVLHLHLAFVNEPHAFLIGEIVEASSRIDARHERQIRSVRDAPRRADLPADIDEALAALHADR